MPQISGKIDKMGNAVSDNDNQKAIAGVVLAGGKSRRFRPGDGGSNGNKAGAMLGSEHLLTLTMGRARKQVRDLALNINQALDFPLPDNLAHLPQLPDRPQIHAGPLAGVLAGLEWAASLRDPVTHLACFAVDTPFFPDDFVARLLTEKDRGEIICAENEGHHHYLASLWPVSLAGDLRRKLEDEPGLSVRSYLATRRTLFVLFPEQDFDPFFNINRTDDMTEAEKIYQRHFARE
jgi:molybdenum cofactor guanylyltransferase